MIKQIDSIKIHLLIIISVKIILMNILYFLTYGYNLKTWHDTGQLFREIKHFEKLHKEDNNLNFVIFSYGDESDSKFINKDFIKIVPIYKYKKVYKWKVVNLINSLFYKKLLKTIGITDSKLIIQNQLLGCWIPILIKKKLKIPLIIRTGYDMYEFSILEKKSTTKKLFFKYLTYIGLRFSDIYTVTSNCDKQFLINNFSYKFNSKIKIRPNWVNTQERTFDESNISKFNKKIVTVGRIEKQKNYEMIIRALEETEYELDIYGEGSLKKNIEQLAKNLNVKVNFFGIVNNEELFIKLRKYTYYISSSTFEGNPKSVLEAMSAGCVVIASKIKNHLEFLNNQNSILFENNINSLNEVLISLERNKEKNIYLIANAHKTVKENYTLQKLVNNELEDIKRLVT